MMSVLSIKCIVEHPCPRVVEWCWLCLKPVIIMIDDAACCEKRLMLLESLRHGIIRTCPSNPFENVIDVLGMVCACSAFMDEGSVIGTSLFVERI